MNYIRPRYLSRFTGSGKNNQYFFCFANRLIFQQFFPCMQCKIKVPQWIASLFFLLMQMSVWHFQTHVDVRPFFIIGTISSMVRSKGPKNITDRSKPGNQRNQHQKKNICRSVLITKGDHNVRCGLINFFLKNVFRRCRIVACSLMQALSPQFISVTILFSDPPFL